ncbi:MAG: SCO family protein [Gammaproteobacteria bacterium]|nr:SCO family protein [Gammaproteobacteria bacterium]
MNIKKTTLYTGLLILLISVSCISYFFSGNIPRKTIPDELVAVIRNQPVKLKPFQLTDQNNKAFTIKQLQHKQSLLFFGYTSCPDICPTTLSSLNNMLAILQQKNPGTSPQVIFVSVDPERDTIEKLNSYLHYFNQDFIALTGNMDEIDRFTKQFGAGYFVEKNNSDDNYLISHASSIFLVDQNLRLVAAFSPPHYPKILAEQYVEVLKFIEHN